MEGYGLEELVASAESAVEGLGLLAAGLARLAGDARQVVTLDAMEALVIERGRELLRGVVQLSLDAQAGRAGTADVHRLPTQWAGPWREHEHEHDRNKLSGIAVCGPTVCQGSLAACAGVACR